MIQSTLFSPTRSIISPHSATLHIPPPSPLTFATVHRHSLTLISQFSSSYLPNHLLQPAANHYTPPSPLRLHD
ncbi:hypothetical protein HanLR1_Chr15g0577751 [Helianthus annuus]|nr:hypothetical protein HanLR1_Chr15g0577751 [Helianthus annuus]